MTETDSRAAVLAAVDEARLVLEAAAEREHRARWAYEGVEGHSPEIRR